MTRKVLVVDDDAAVREAIGQTLELADLEPIQAASFIVGKDHISRDFDGVILSDIRMPGRDGFFLLDHAQQVDADLPVILLTGEGDIPMAVSAMQAGAFGFLEKPCAPADMLAALTRALRTRALVLENRDLKAEMRRGDAAARMLHGRSAAAEALRDRVRMAARAGVPVLIQGPRGAGLSKVAEVIHLLGSRAAEPFVKRAAVALDPADLTEALAQAAGGSLYLDEIAGLPAATQVALADAMDAGAARLPVILAGDSDALEAAEADGRFGPDLHERLRILPVRIPALAERPEDIPVLFRHYVSLAAEQGGIEPPAITAETEAALMRRDWPGNARSLMNAAMQFVLGLSDAIGSDETTHAAGADGPGLAERMMQVERQILADTLAQAGGRAAQAADALKLPRKTFYDKLTRHGLRAEDFRP